MTVTRTSSPRLSSMTAPKMTLAFGSAWLGHDFGRLVDLEQADVGGAGDVEQHAGRPVEGRLEERRRHRRVRRGCRAALAARRADAHQRRACVAHDRADVREVEVHEPGDGDQVGDALHALAEDVVGHPERLEDRGRLLDHLEQPVVLDHDQRVDPVAEVLEPPSA